MMKKSNKIILGLAGCAMAAVGAGMFSVRINNSSMQAVHADVTSDTKFQVWVTSDNVDWTSDSAYTRLGAWGGDAGGYTLYNADYQVTAGQVYYRFTLSTNITGIKFERWGIQDSQPKKWNETGNAADSFDTIVKGACYYVYESSSWNFTTSTGAAKNGVVTAEFFGKVLEGVETCSSSAVNGYGLYSNINTNFYSKLSSSADLHSVTLTDYSQSSYAANENSYTGLTPDGTVEAFYKWDRIKSLATSGSGANIVVNSAIDDSFSTVAVAALAGAAVLVSGGYFFSRKKKHIA